jgi:allophanate hydrolase
MSVRDISADVSAGRVKAERVAADALVRITAYDAVQPQTWIRRVPDSDVLAAARGVDARIAAGEHLPLAGVPYAVKDNIDVAGMPTTAACPEFSYVPEESATVVSKLAAAGAILVGKTNLDQFATGLVGTRSPYGIPACVFNRKFVSGGSSSGSAVAVGAGLVSISLGSDTAGSGRVPAAFNGLVGYKPTRGRFSARGLVPACRSLDCVSTFTTNVDDAELLDEVLAGFDAADSYSRRPEHPVQPDWAGPAPAAGERFRFGVARPDQLQFFGDAESAGLYAVAVERLVSSGGSAVELDIAPLLNAAQLLYSGPWVAERTAVLGELLQKKPGAIHPVVRAIIAAGNGVSGAQTFKGMYDLQDYKRAAEAVWSSVDVLVLPTTPTSYRISELLAEPVALNSNLGFYTNFVNLLDMSAIAVPAGFRVNGTGFGVSLIGPAWSESSLFTLARRYLKSAALPAAPALDLSGRPDSVQLAVVGAHLAGMPLHWQLTSRNARLVRATRTAATYRLYAMTGVSPPKPALVHVGVGGGAIELEVYELDVAAFGSFVAEVPAPLAIGTVLLEDGSAVKGFVSEPRAITGARDITSTGGWRAYLAAR